MTRKDGLPSVRFMACPVGYRRTPGWLVFYDGAFAVSLFQLDDGRVGREAGLFPAFNCTSYTWPSIEAAKAEIRRLLLVPEPELIFPPPDRSLTRPRRRLRHAPAHTR